MGSSVGLRTVTVAQPFKWGGRGVHETNLQYITSHLVAVAGLIFSVWRETISMVKRSLLVLSSVRFHFVGDRHEPNALASVNNTHTHTHTHLESK
jgi:hypothetical protein